jgi:hypothetical protein
MLTTSVALGISTGVSVYEAESLEQKAIADLEKALFMDLPDTNIQKIAQNTHPTCYVNQLWLRRFSRFGDGYAVSLPPQACYRSR